MRESGEGTGPASEGQTVTKIELPVFRRDDVPAGSVYCIPHAASAVHMATGEVLTLPTGIYANTNDPRSDEELHEAVEGVDIF